MNQEIKKRIEDINNGIVPEGYKRTEFGIFPCDWETVSIGDISTNKGEYGLNAPACEYDEKLPKYIRITDIDDNGNYVDSGACVDFEDNEQRFTLNDGDIVFARTGASVGRNYLYKKKDGKLLYAGFLIKFSFNKSCVNPYIVHANCNTKQYWNWIKKVSARSGQPGVNAEEYSKYEFVKAKDNNEQAKIAEILMKWDEAIELQEQYIEKLNARKRFLLKYLYFVRPNWGYIVLGTAVKTISSGGTPSTANDEYFGGNIVWVSIDDISQSDKLIYDSVRKLTKKGIENSSAKVFPQGTLLYAMYASIGKCAIARVECATSQAILGIVPDGQKLDTEYLYYYFCSVQDKIALKGQKGTQANLNKGMVSKLKIPIPMNCGNIDLKMQNRIASILSNVDEEISLQKEKLAKIKKQRKAMQQYLLTGIVRA